MPIRVALRVALPAGYAGLERVDAALAAAAQAARDAFAFELTPYASPADHRQPWDPAAVLSHPARGGVLDVLGFDGDDLHDMVRAGVLMPLAEISPAIAPAGEWPGLEDLGRSGGTRYAEAVTVAPWMIFYDAATVSAAGTSIPEAWDLPGFLRAARAIAADTNGDGLLDRIGFQQVAGAEAVGLRPTAPPAYAWILAATGALPGPGRWTDLESPLVVEAVRFMGDLIPRYRVGGRIDDLPRMQALLAAREVGMLAYPIESAALFWRGLVGQITLDLSPAPFPCNATGRTPVEVPLMLGVHSASADPARALAALRLLTAALGDALLVPANPAQADDLGRQWKPWTAADQRALASAMRRASAVRLTRAQKAAFIEAIDLPVLLRNVDPDTALRDARQRLEALPDPR
ncbi:MAG: hypothetical protein FJ029_02555 [Actinobacteria bacterium]|nr:hypothetical protein [Actinomycetota bacterium]